MRTPSAVRFVTRALVFCSLGAAGAPGLGAEELPDRRLSLPDARDVKLIGRLGAAYDQCVRRLGQDPYRSLVYLRSDLSFEMKRSFTNYSGDISGRFLEVASLTSPPGLMAPETLPGLLRGIARYQKADGHFGRDVDWNTPLEPESPDAVILPIFWGNARLLVGLLEAHCATGREDLLECARRIGDFYVATADRFLDPAREQEYRATGTYAAGYVTTYFPAIEGLVRLYQATKTERYLHQAERMAAFFQRFDHLPIDHSHGNLITHHGLVLLYEATGKAAYLERMRDHWRQAWEGGYVWPTGGVGEKFRVAYSTDEGCAEADWLRLNLDLWRVTGETRFLEAADRLVCNHYEMNRTANGGFGHHQFVCDDEGPLLMKPEFTEAVWCCTFHGLLGLHTLRSYLVVGSESGLFINFPTVDVAASVRAGGGVWNVTVQRDKDEPQAIACRVRLDGKDASGRGAARLPAEAGLGRPGAGRRPCRPRARSAGRGGLPAPAGVARSGRRGRGHLLVRSTSGGPAPAPGRIRPAGRDTSARRGVAQRAMGAARPRGEPPPGDPPVVPRRVSGVALRGERRLFRGNRAERRCGGRKPSRGVAIRSAHDAHAMASAPP